MANYWDTQDDQDEDDVGYDRPSKSQIKRELEALQDLGKEMTGLPRDTLNRIPLPEDVRDAIDEYAKMRSLGAKRRQLQLIGKLMRNLDYDAVRQAIDMATGESKAAVAAHHKAEHARSSLDRRRLFDGLHRPIPGRGCSSVASNDPHRQEGSSNE